jgi:predicted CoA-substrate-specific enzyme activase
MSFVGVNIGSLSVKVVAVRGDDRAACVVAHRGRPREVLEEVLAGKEFADAEAFGVCGHGGAISEAAAIQRALRELADPCDAVVSLGGESFLVYIVADGRILHVLSHNKCAAGSGEFFIQQIGRMGLGCDDAIRLSFDGKVVPLASRCSVHCKSDITHKLNRHEAAPADILHTLHDGMANKVIALLEKGQCELRRVLLIGGLTRNAAMVAALRGKLPEVEFVVRPESPWFEAWGAALLTRDQPVHNTPQLASPPELGKLPSLAGFAHLVQVIAPPLPANLPDGPLALGVDAGSTTTKAVLLDPATRAVVASHYTRTHGDPITATRECLRALAAAAGNRPIGLAATTGSARELIGAFLGTNRVYNEISAHAAGATHFDPEVDTIFEIGGQDSKYIHLRNGVPIDYAMNNACSAGTGSFLEESARGDLGLAVSEIADLALAAPAPVQFKATCAAFINSDIRLAQQQGHSRENIVAGLVYAIAGNYLQRVKGPRVVGRKVFLQGGVALNRAVGHAFAQSVGRPVVIPPAPELLGALGVVLLALERERGAADGKGGAPGRAGESADRSAQSKGAPLLECGDLSPLSPAGTCPGVAPGGVTGPTGRAADGDRAPRDLLSLAGAEMKLIGRFTCRACKMYCSIDRFEVRGRRFPFGGRCSLFEHAWKGGARTAAAPDLVDERADLLFDGVQKRIAARPPKPPAPPEARPAPRWGVELSLDAARAFIDDALGRSDTGDFVLPPGTRVGIPRALTTHSLFPLYATFFSELGFEIVLSGVDPEGELKSYSGFCFPVQIAHGAVLDLARRDVRVVFLPHVVRMPQPNPCRDSYLCPITQAGPYFLAKAFPEQRFLSPLLDFTEGYAASTALVEMAMRELGAPSAAADGAWAAAVQVQTEADNAMRALGQAALGRAIARGEPAVLLTGHSYNAFSAEASQSVGRKLASMGIEAIPADCLTPVGEGPTAWHFANQVMNAVELTRRHPNLFLVCVSNFSCTVDAFTHAQLASEMGARPYLLLEIDAHTADAGVQTRLEAFLDTVRNFRGVEAARAHAFVPARLVKGGRVVRSNGESVSVKDPRVKFYFMNFSQYHTQALGMAARWMGLHVGEPSLLDRQQLERGLQHTSGRECLPLPICVGELLKIAENRAPGEIVGFQMLRGGAPCVIDAYMAYFERFIAEHKIADVFLANPNADNDYLGYDVTTFMTHLPPAVFAADIMVEIEYVLRVVGAPGALDRLREIWREFVVAADSLEHFHSGLPGLIKKLAALPRMRDPATCPRVIVTGDFFTRFSPFFMDGVCELYAAHGIILKPVDLSEIFFYGTYDDAAETAGEWGMKPGSLAFAKACTRIFQPDGKRYLHRWLSVQAGRRAEEFYRAVFRRTGLLVAGPNDMPSVFENAAEHVSPSIYGELVPTVGKALEAGAEGYDGVILIGPFNCLPFRVSEAILKPLSIERRMPLLTYESDGYAVSPAVLRQVDVHVQQVLEHAAAAKEARARGGLQMPDFLKAAMERLK